MFPINTELAPDPNSGANPNQEVHLTNVYSIHHSLPPLLALATRSALSVDTGGFGACPDWRAIIARSDGCVVNDYPHDDVGG